MTKDDDKRVMDGPITTSMRSDPPSPESIQALRERYALFDKMTTKKPATSFDRILAVAGQGGRDHAASESAEAAASSASSTHSQSDVAVHAGPGAVSGTGDTFERADANALGRRSPLPSVRHPDSPAPKGKSKVIIKV